MVYVKINLTPGSDSPDPTSKSTYLSHSGCADQSVPTYANPRSNKPRTTSLQRYKWDSKAKA
jgi:hypothetical protein